MFEIYQKYGLNHLHSLSIKETLGQVVAKENQRKVWMRSIDEKKMKETDLLAKKDMDAVVRLREDLTW